MTIELSPQLIITAGGVVTASGVLIGLVAKVVRWKDKQDQQDEKIETLKKTHNEDKQYINDELTLLTYGVLACLKGLMEKGCNGPVKEAADKIEKHLNESAHNT